ncbi:MAG: CDP-alcohol phosphatidyltransferase family protein [Oscillospiraceae bacterium]|jgi:CDP-diacylglycerol--glycerol-3-phosphate 3-phosphatidyltransferase|nr:CDP-alcohol phosphatidyltransferase family protein [Oscillospiraceae bacterium]
MNNNNYDDRNKRGDEERVIRLFNLPNTLTALRIVSIVFYLYYFFNDRIWAALIVFCIAALTDILDGWIARRRSEITWLGKMLDPIADKLMIVAALISLAARGWAEWWLIAVVAAKESLMLLGGLILLKRRVIIQALPIGKASTAVFLLAIALTFFREWTQPADTVAQIAACAITVLALIIYAIEAWRRWKAAGAKISDFEQTSRMPPS